MVPVAATEENAERWQTMTATETSNFAPLAQLRTFDTDLWRTLNQVAATELTHWHGSSRMTQALSAALMGRPRRGQTDSV